ncbi:ATP-dependent DNA helicase Rep [Streptomyces sp. enrichment culture]
MGEVSTTTDASAVPSPSLTAEQQAVVERPATDAVLVTAGAGAGKTHTLVRRLEHLVSDEGLATGEILVLTFSRAAVRELRERLEHLDGRSRFVRVKTFDSWAAEILEEAGETFAGAGYDFDACVKQATQVLADEKRAPERLDELCHLVVDEVQDLVGARRELVETFLETYTVGFTVVGDPSQAIYHFQVRDRDERELAANGFFDWIRSYFADELVELSLSGDFRFETHETRAALSHAPGLSAPGERATAEAAYERLRTCLLGLDAFGDLGLRLYRETLAAASLSTAILCRTNGQALLIADWLWELGIPNQLRRSGQDRAVPCWVRALVAAAPAGQALDRRRFAEFHAEEFPDEGSRHRDRLWRALRSCAGDRTGAAVDPGRLREAISTGRVPEELTEQQPHALTVSTFHRAKGLEFDRVLVVDPGPLTLPPESPAVDVADHARSLYVAMTRAREQLFRLDPPPEACATTAKGFARVRKGQRTDRWARFDHQPWKRLGMEVKAGDIHAEHPAGMHLLDCDPEAVQKYLREQVTPGDEVELTRLDNVPEDHERRVGPGYVLRHGGQVVGIASDTFREHLYRYLMQSNSYRPRNWPRHITRLHIDLVECVTGAPECSDRHAVARTGLWLAPRPVGLGLFHYDPKPES